MKNEGGKTIGAWVLVMAAAVVALKALDRLPSLLAGATHGARVFATIEEAERAIGEPVWLPAYYPEELGWPPSRIEATATAPVTVVVGLPGQAGREDRLTIAQSIGTVAPPPPSLLPAADRLGAADVAVGRHRGTLARVLVGPYEWHELWWNQGGRRVTLRYDGPVDTLLLMAGSLERRAGRTR